MKDDSNKGAILWMLILLGIISGFGAYFYLYPESLPKWAARTPVGQAMQTTTVYKWKDHAGVWQITDRPPAVGIKYEIQNYSHDANVLLPPLPDSSH